jgi:hypothetical protein
MISFQYLYKLLFQLRNKEWKSLHLVILHELILLELRSQVTGKLSHVEFAYDPVFESFQHLLRISRQRMDVIELDKADTHPRFLQVRHRTHQSAVCSAPADHEQIARRFADGLQFIRSGSRR